MTKQHNGSLKVTTECSPIYRGAERRSKPRLVGHFPTKVRGVDADEQAFESDVFADNISASGVYFSLRRYLEYGTRLFIVVRLPGGATATDSGTFVAAYADVVRSEPQTDGLYGVAVSLKRQRTLDGQ